MTTTKLKTVLFAASSLSFLLACATEGDTRTASQRSEPCPVNRTYVCEERIGQVQNCKCLHKDDMRDIYDLRGDRH
ncbi:MAG: hypothetical protein AAFN50_07905 [Pseudomonadota bacterium]